MSEADGIPTLDLCEACRPKVKTWLVWLEGKLREITDSTPELDPAYLDGLGWTLFASGKGAWIFRDAAGAKALSEGLERARSGLTIGGYQYKVTRGKDREFISRFEIQKP